MDNKLIMNTAATCYQEAFPIGNGRMGAMMFGDMVRERVVLNESSMWSGSKQDNNRKDAHKYLDEIRQLLFAGENDKAQKIFEEHFNCKGAGSGFATAAKLQFGCYQTLGNLDLFFHQKISASYGRGQSMSGGGQCENSQNYERKLNLDTGIAQMSYSLYGADFKRECLASKKYECIVYHVSVDHDKYLNFNAQINRSENFSVTSKGDDGLLMTGQLDNGVDGEGVRYACYVRVKVIGGNIGVQNDNTLQVRDAREAFIYVTAATDMKSFGARNIDDLETAVQNDMDKAYCISWEEMKKEHIEYFSELYNRTEFNIYGENQDMPIDLRLDNYRKNKEDIGLCELLFNYSKYLLISSTREDGIPANLQGIWADEVQTPWNGDWHLDAQQMNFWSAENCNMSKLHMPYLRLAESMVESGRVTAKDYYNSRGWVSHVITNPWGYTAPGEEAYWGATTTGSAWVCQHLWEHFLYTGDRDYLSWAYPTLKGCAEFYNDFLVYDESSGYWVTSPANSPENSFVMENGSVVQLCIAPTYDMQLIRYLFKACAEACEILDADLDFAKEIRKKADLLVPTQIGKDGRIQEWMHEYKEYLPYHRHLSHLWGLYPGNEITVQYTPKLAQAALNSINSRGKSSAGWANLMRMGMLARLNKAEEAYEMLAFQLEYNCFPNLLGRTFHALETIKNPEMPKVGKYDYPFQIDCNLAMAGIIVEMIMQSHIINIKDGEYIPQIILLPALTDKWKNGYIRGIRARGGFELEIKWINSKLEWVRITGTYGENFEVSYKNNLKSYKIAKGGVLYLDENLIPMSR